MPISSEFRFVPVRIIALAFSFNVVAASTTQSSTGAPTSVVLPDCEIEFRDNFGGTRVIEARDTLVSPPSVAINIHKNGTLFTIQFSCEEASSRPGKQERFRTAGLTAIGTRRNSGAWEPAIDGRYYSNLKWAVPIRGRNWNGILAYVEGWEGDGQNTGERSLGFCAAPEYRVCGVATERKNDTSDVASQALSSGTVAMLTEIYEGLVIRKRVSK